MMDLQSARSYLKDRIPPTMAFTDSALNRALVRGFNKLWRSRTWKMAEARDQIATVEDYTTGTITTLANGGTAVTFSGTALDATFIGRFLRVGESATRDYEIIAVGGATGCTIKDPYEGTAISAGSETFRISKKIYRLPWDFMSSIAFKDTTNNSWLPVISRKVFERKTTEGNLTGQVECIVEAGFTTSAMHTTGTIAITQGTSAVAGTATAWDSRMAGRTLVVDGYPFRFKIASVDSATDITLDQVWPFETISGMTYMIDPPGTPLIELYPVHDENASIQVFYYRLPPDIVMGHSIPAMYPEFDDLWIDCTLNVMGLFDEALLEKRIGDLADRDGIERTGPWQLGSYGDSGQIEGGIRTSPHTRPVPWYEE